MLRWENYLKIAKNMGLQGTGSDIDGAEEFIAKMTVSHYRPKRPEEVVSVYPITYFKENLVNLFDAILNNILLTLHCHGPEIKGFDEQLFIKMIFFKHESLTLGNAAKRLKTDAQLFDIWRKIDPYSQRITECLESTPGGVFKETENASFYVIEGEAPSWALWAEGIDDTVNHCDLFSLGEDMEERIRAVLALEPEENISALEKSREEIERLQSERKQLEKENRGMLANLRKPRHR
jgi:hypothetical protein